MQDCAEPVKEIYKQDNLDFGQLEMNGDSLSIPFIDRDLNYSFSYASPAVSEYHLMQSDVITSSFSSIPVENNILSAESGGFSFSNCNGSSATEFPVPISSISSFTFFSPDSALDNGHVFFEFDALQSQIDPTHGGMRIALLFLLFVRLYIVANRNSALHDISEASLPLCLIHVFSSQLSIRLSRYSRPFP